MVIALIFVHADDSRKRMTCNTWTIRSDGAFEAETNTGTILFRRDDIQLIEPHYNKTNSHTWVCVGNLQRLVWIDFPNEAQALQFIDQMEQELSRTRF